MERERPPVEIKSVKQVIDDLIDGCITLNDVIADFSARGWPPLLDRTDETTAEMYARAERIPDNNDTFWIGDHRLEYNTYRRLMEAVYAARLVREEENRPFTVKQLMEWLSTGAIAIPQVIAEIKKYPRLHVERWVDPHSEYIDPPTDDDISWIELKYYRDDLSYQEFERLHAALEESHHL